MTKCNKIIYYFDSKLELQEFGIDMIKDKRISTLFGLLKLKKYNSNRDSKVGLEQ